MFPKLVTLIVLNTSVQSRILLERSTDANLSVVYIDISDGYRMSSVRHCLIVLYVCIYRCQLHVVKLTRLSRAWMVDRGRVIYVQKHRLPPQTLERFNISHCYLAMFFCALHLSLRFTFPCLSSFHAYHLSMLIIFPCLSWFHAYHLSMLVCN